LSLTFFVSKVLDSTEIFRSALRR